MPLQDWYACIVRVCGCRRWGLGAGQVDTQISFRTLGQTLFKEDWNLVGLTSIILFLFFFLEINWANNQQWYWTGSHSTRKKKLSKPGQLDTPWGRLTKHGAGWYNPGQVDTLRDKLIHPGAGWYSQGQVDTPRDKLIHPGAGWLTLVQLDTPWGRLIHPGAGWYTLGQVDIPRGKLIHPGAGWLTLGQLETPWGRLIHPGAGWYTLGQLDTHGGAGWPQCF